MTLKPITYSQLKEAIRVSFENDKAIFEFYDRNVTVNSLEDIVNDIYHKIGDYGDIIILKGVYMGEELIGYVAKTNNLLISFSIAIKYRSKENTCEFFDLIKEDFQNMFYCYLWSINLRAINWLKKMGMEIIFNNNNIIKLQCQLQPH